MKAAHSAAVRGLHKTGANLSILLRLKPQANCMLPFQGCIATGFSLDSYSELVYNQ